MPPSRRLPRGLPVLLGLTVLGTVLYRTVWPGLFRLVRRDPDALGHGQVWRVISPVLVQPDPIGTAITVFVLVGIAGLLGERFFGTRRMVLLYLGGALAAHVVGEWWQPYGSGVSVAGCGVLGGLAVWWLRMRAPGPVSAGLGVALIALLAVSVRDIHGVGIAAGMLIGVFVLRDVPAVYRGRERG